MFRSFRPDFVLVRERIRGVETKADAKTFLFGLIHGNVPSLNSLEATLSFMEKPLMVINKYIIPKKSYLLHMIILLHCFFYASSSEKFFCFKKTSKTLS